MNPVSKASFFVVICSILLVSSGMQQKPKKVVFFGDSITELGVQKAGFITQIKAALPPDGYSIVGAGVGGNKVYDLYLRLETDVLAQNPDLVVIYVGINDVWHKELSKTGTDYDKYLKFYQALILKIQAAGSKVVLCTPSVIGEKKNGANPQDKELDRYAEGIRQLAIKNDLQLCDLRKIFMDYETANNTEDKDKGILTTDRVHLNTTGNQLVANSLLPFVK